MASIFKSPHRYLNYLNTPGRWYASRRGIYPCPLCEKFLPFYGYIYLRPRFFMYRDSEAAAAAVHARHLQGILMAA